MRANRYVSYLAAEIEPKAQATLNQWERQATQTMERIAAAGTKGTGGAGRAALFGPQIQSLKQLQREVDPTVRKIREVDTATRKAADGSGLMARSFQRTGQALQIVQGPLGPLAGRLSALSAVMQTLTGYSLAGVLGGGGAFALGSIASQYQNMTDRLRPLYDDQKQLNAALADVVGIAQRSRQALEPVVELYAKMTLAGRAAGISDERSSRLAELASKAARISGGRAATQEAGLTQFAQGFGSGTLSGEELKSIKENTLFLAKSIADGLGVPIAKLKELGAEGKLTPQVIEAALLRSAASIDAAFSKLPKRIGSSLTELSTNFSVFIGQIDDATGTTTAVANALSLVAQNLDLVTGAVVLTAAAFSASTFARFAEHMIGVGKSAGQAVGNVVALHRAVQSGNAVLINSAQAAQQRARFVAEGARAENAAATAAVKSAGTYRQQLTANISLLDKQIAAQRRALETARTLDAAGRVSGRGGNSALVKKATEDLNNSLRTRIATQRLLTASTAELTAADARLTAATRGLIVAETELVIADNAAAASSGRLAVAKTVLTGALARVSAAASSLVAFLGGPWGLAFTAAAGLAYYLATRVDEAKAATDSFKGSQEGLPGTLDNTTAALERQSAAARQLAVDLQRAEVLKARDQAMRVGDQFGGDVAAAINNISGLDTWRNPQAKRDKEELRRILREVQAGNFNFERDYGSLSDIQRRNPDAFKGSIVQRLFGMDPSRIQTDVVGLDRSLRTLGRLRKEMRELEAGVDKLPPAPNLSAGGGKVSKAQLNAQAAIQAASSDLARAKAELAAAKQKGPLEGESNEAYIDRIAQMTRSVKALADAEKGASKARSNGAAEARKAAAIIETASDKADRLASIMDRYEEDTPVRRLERLTDEAEKAKRAIDDLVGERVEGFDGAFTQKDADFLKDKIDRSVEVQSRRPVTESIESGRQRLEIMDLEARGLGELAELTRRRYELEQQVGELLPEEVDAIRQQIADERQLNDILDERSRIIENNARFLGEVRDAGRDAIRAFLDGDIGGGIKNFAKRISDAYKDALANEISFKLFGDPEKKYRDDMTRGLNNSAERLTGSSGRLDRSADSLERAADALSTAASTQGGVAPTGDGGLLPSLLGQSAPGASILDQIYVGISDLTQSVDNASAVWDEQTGDIVVKGRRMPSAGPIQMPGGIDTIVAPLIGGVLEKVGIKGNIGNVIASALGSLLGQGKAGGALGGVLSGNGIGGIIGAGLAGGLSGGVQGALSAVGGKLGGMLGNAILPGIGGAIGSVLGSIGGSLLGGLFGGRKVKKGSATITDLSGNFRLSGNSKSAKANATSGADSVVSGLQRIIDALGGELGAFNVSIGTRDGQWRVDPTGRGRTKKKKGAIDFDDDAEAAIRFAIMDAIQDGAVQGIRESTQRLLRAGKDLDVALEKALKFEDVFRRLKRFKDPVGAAVDDVNREFNSLIKIFREAGASAEEWAQLEELYGLERAKAIEEATEAASQALDDFIQSVTSGPDSPLSRRTVYQNAKAEVDKFRADIAAGKAVDQDKLITALENFQAASEELNGSRAQFFTDFADILALAQAARDNVPGPNTGDLPPSPFENLETTNTLIQEQVNLQQTGNGLLEAILRAIQGTGSTINSLPTGAGANAVFGDQLNVAYR